MSTASASAAMRSSPAGSPSAARRSRSRTSTSHASGATGPLAEQLQGFSWLRDLAAAASREKGARLAEAVVGRWLLAHGTKVDEAWAPHLWGERILFWAAYAPYILSSGDAGYRSALLNTLARGARHVDSTADKAAAGLDRVTAWCGVVAAGLLVQGGVPRVARGEAGLARALASAQFDDGGLISRSPYEQVLLVDRFGLLRACYQAAKQTAPDGIEAAAQASLAALHGVTMGDGALSSWQGCGPGEASRLTALIDGCGHARATAAPGARLGLPAHVRARHDPGARRRTAAAAEDGRTGLAPRPWRSSCRTAASGWWSIAAGPALCRPIFQHELVEGLRTTAAHSTLVLADTNSTNILADGIPRQAASRTSTIDRSEDNDASRLEASHDGYVRAFGLIHKRSLMLGNDGKELRGADQLIARGRKQDPRGRTLCRPLPPRTRGRSDDHRRRHGRDPALARRAAVELPLPRRQPRTRGKSVDRWPRSATAHEPACHRRRSFGIGRRNRLDLPPRQLTLLSVIASGAKQSSWRQEWIARRCAPRNDGSKGF